MSLRLTWQRAQDKKTIRERITKARVRTLWLMVWVFCTCIGLCALIYIILIVSFSSAVNVVLSASLLYTGILIGILGGMFIARRFVEAWSKPVPLSYILGKKKNTATVEVSEYVSMDTLKAIDASFLYSTEWYPWYLFSELLKHKRIEHICMRLGIDYAVMVKKARLITDKNLKDSTKEAESLFKGIVFKALEIAYQNNDNEIHVGDVFTAMMSVPCMTRDFLVDYGVRYERLRGVNSWLHFERQLRERKRSERDTMLIRTHNWRNQLWTSTVTPLLDAVGDDITRYVYQLPPFVARAKELSELYEHFATGSFGAVIVGPRGAGKTRFIEGLAQKIIAQAAPPPLADRRVITLSLAKLLSLSNTRTPFKVVAAQFANEIARSGNIIAVLEDLAVIESIKTDEAGMMIESLLVDMMRSGHVLLFATVTSEEIAQLSGPLFSSLPRIQLASLDNEKTLQVVESTIPQLEAQFRVQFTYPALERAVELAGRFIHDEAQPGKTISLLRFAAQQHHPGRERTWITVHEIEVLVSDKTGLPVTQITHTEEDMLINLEQRIAEKYINQRTAVASVAAALRRARTELKSEKRPIANLLFLGPTGVGKTELARRLADIYFGGEQNMVRLDMSEYQEVQSLRNLIGAPVGTTGQAIDGHLIHAIRKNPFAVILLDEFEKAHQDVLNIFLQVMEDGRLTAPNGEVYDFTNSLIIATSNAGAHMIQDELRTGSTSAEISEKLKQHELHKHFKPELLNRFDAIVIFEALAFHHIVEVAKLLLASLKEKLEEREIGFDIVPEALQELAKAGYDPTLGARPLRRVIQDRIEDTIAKLLLTREVQARDSIIVKEGFDIEVMKAEHYN